MFGVRGLQEMNLGREVAQPVEPDAGADREYVAMRSAVTEAHIKAESYGSFEI